MSELELKFLLDPAAAERWRATLKAAGARRMRLRAVYQDTPDGRLTASRIALRMRQEGPRWVQTVKAAGESAVHRLEHEVRVTARGGVPPAIDVERHRSSPVHAALMGALGDVGVASLQERFTTDVARLARVFRTASGTDLEAALDMGAVSAAGRRADIGELELEHKGGPVEGLFDAAGQAVEAGGLWISTVSKAQSGEQLVADAPAAAVKAGAMRLPDGVDGTAMLQAVLHNALEHVLGNASLVADGEDSAEVVHQLRVGLRRLRTALRELAWLDDRIEAAWDGVLGHTFGLLGQRRDSEEVGHAVRPLLEAARAPKTAWDAPAFADPVAAVRAVPFQAALLRVLALAHAAAPSPVSMSAHELRKRVAARLQRLHHQVVRDGRVFDRLPIERQHQVRKRLKRLRYLAEFVLPLWQGKAAQRYIDRLKPAQEALGAHNDCAVAGLFFERDAQTDARSWFAAGYLRGHLGVTQRAARRALRKLGSAEPFWA